MSARCQQQRDRDDDHRSDSALSSAAFTCIDCRGAILWIEHCKRAVGQQPNPLIEREVEEAAMPGHRPALSRFPMSPGNSPSRIASCHQRHRDLSFDRLESSHVFAVVTLGQNLANRNNNFAQPCAEAVEDETSLWKAEENCGENCGLGRNAKGAFNNLDDVKEMNSAPALICREIAIAESVFRSFTAATRTLPLCRPEFRSCRRHPATLRVSSKPPYSFRTSPS